MGLPPVIINDVKLEPKSELHRRKLEALRRFVERLLSSPVRGDIAKIILFGSALDGDIWEESDVDLLVFGARNLAAVNEACIDASFEVGLEAMESIEPLVYGLSDLCVPHSYFVFTVIRDGREIYSMDRRELDLAQLEGAYSLAFSYLRVAEYVCENGDHREAADLAYNAAEAMVKALLLLEMDKLPKTHPGIVNRFGDLYVRTGRVPRELGRDLRRALKIRGRARYDWDTEITGDEAAMVIELARRLANYLSHIKEEISHEREENA